ARDADGVADALPHRTRLATSLHRTRAEKQELQEVATVERQLRDLLFSDRLPDRGRRGVQDQRIRLHFDRLRYVSKRQRQVDPLDLIDGEHHVRVNGDLEP